MVVLNKQNLLPTIWEFFSKFGLYGHAKSYFTANKFSDALILDLSQVCTHPQNRNRAKSSSKQTHIHITGANRSFFYREDDYKNIRKSSDYKRVLVEVELSNIHYLQSKARGNTTFITNTFKDVLSYTEAKVAYRANQESQVQLSRLRYDDINFINLRKALFPHDYLIFLKYANEEKFFALGIDKDSATEIGFTLEEGIINGLESDDLVTIRSAIEHLEKEVDVNTVISKSDALEDVIYQNLVDKTELPPMDITFKPEPFDTKTTGNTTGSNRIKTNPSIGKLIIKNSDYQCALKEEEAGHDTFPKQNGELYMEVHHLIPISKQSRFANKLDVYANIVPLCPNCHKKIHLAKKEIRKELLEKLFLKCQENLIKSGLGNTNDGEILTLELLESFYD